MAQQFSTLHTDIQSDAIPTCICEKSIADKVEKMCLRCGGVLGSGVAPSVGLLGTVAIDQWKNAAITEVTKYALAKGAAKGVAEGNALGINIVIRGIKSVFFIEELDGTSLKSFFTTTAYTDISKIVSVIDTEMSTSCGLSSACSPICGARYTLNIVAQPGKTMVKQKDAITKGVIKFVGIAKDTASFKATQVSSETSSRIITKGNALIEAGFDSSTTSIYASIIVILIIVLIMCFK
ncbi:rifin [Plasmodium falciparum RAJ116]|uniref:Rifin n=1 Tax=Plasmodium falciparum RAJ116 TaxID=580058 RepID=A0A0L0CY70_PLAFA|nr:rifin [Plasmodium falciparum RAJ116]